MSRCLLYLLIYLSGALNVLAEVGIGQSGLFTVDTRWKDFEGSGISSYFTVDTRYSGSAGEAFSGLFLVDTRGAATGTAVIAGRVTDANGVGLGGATVSALLNNVLRGQADTDAGGYFTLPALPAGTYAVQAQQANYVGSIHHGLTLAHGQSVWQGFALTPLPGAPEVVDTARPPDAPASIVNSQLKRWSGGAWVTVTGMADVNRAHPTVVLTHGWNSHPYIWADGMARNLVGSGVTEVNLLAWDWEDNADTGSLLSLAFSRTPGEGRRLAQTLTNLLGTSYAQGLHFIGHSLGTLVNATAADYLHQKTGGAFDWRRTQMTLLDNAELTNVEGRLLPVGYTVAGFESFLGQGEPPPLGWVSPLPDQWQWADNYISLVGLYHFSVVNVWLGNGILYGVLNNPKNWVTEAHGYACNWYADTAQNPNLSILGNRYSFERLGVSAQFPSSSPYSPGSLFVQYPADDYALDTVGSAAAFLAQTAAEFAESKLLSGLSWLAATGEKVGDAVVDVVESGVAVAMDVGQGIQQGATQIASQSIASLRATLSTVASWLPAPPGEIALASRDGEIRAAGDYSPSAVWLPVEIPTNAAMFSFMFRFTGDAGQDVLSVSIAEVNVFALEAQDMPEGELLDSGPIEVTAWQGQTVELFFGLLGGTSTNATISIEGMRFYQLDPPLLKAELVGANLLLSWPATTTGYALESTANLAAPEWLPVTNAPTLGGLRHYVTNAVLDAGRFYRLKRE